MRKKKKAMNVEVRNKMEKGEAPRMPMARRYDETVHPFAHMRNFMDTMDSLIDGFGFERPYPETALFAKDPFDFWRTEMTPEFTPPVEIIERDGQLLVRTELPGMEIDDIDVEITDGLLTITGERKNEFEDEKEGFFRTERFYGTFYRQLPLPESIVTKDAKAFFKNGVLEVTLAAPKGLTNKRKLEITEGEAKLKAAAAGG